MSWLSFHELCRLSELCVKLNSHYLFTVNAFERAYKTRYNPISVVFVSCFLLHLDSIVVSISTEPLSLPLVELHTLVPSVSHLLHSLL